jgi:hypothetical protein
LYNVACRAQSLLVLGKPGTGKVGDGSRKQYSAVHLAAAASLGAGDLHANLFSPCRHKPQSRLSLLRCLRTALWSVCLLLVLSV